MVPNGEVKKKRKYRTEEIRRANGTDGFFTGGPGSEFQCKTETKKHYPVVSTIPKVFKTLVPSEFTPKIAGISGRESVPSIAFDPHLKDPIFAQLQHEVARQDQLSP